MGFVFRRYRHCFLLGVISILSCAGSESRQPISQPGASAPGPEPLVAVGSLARGDLGFRHEGFPAVSKDGALVAVPWTGSDGNRGNVNFRLLVRDIERGTDIANMVIVSADEVTEMDGDEPALLRHIEAGLARANKVLAGREWIPLTGATAGTGDAGSAGVPIEPAPIELAGATVTFQEPRLTVRAGGETLLDESHPEWSVAPASAEGDAPACSHAAYLQRVWMGPKRRALVVVLAYTGSDMCPEPTERVQIFALPG